MSKRPKILTRRNFLALGAASVLGAGFYAWRIEPHWLQFLRHEMPMHNLPTAWHGKTIAQVSDIHVNPDIVDSQYLIDSLEKLADLEPDMIVFTGDFMTCQYDEQISETLRVLQHCPQTPLGNYACLGNHDYGRGCRQLQVADQLCTGLADLNIRVLRNEIIDVSGLQLVGLEDYWSPCFGPDSVLSDVDRRRSSLVLCHNPDVADLSIWSDLSGWILAGHTHGGQCKPPFLPPPLLPVKNKNYTRGIYSLTDKRQMYINAGLGYIKRIRFNVLPEIALFTVAQAS